MESIFSRQNTPARPVLLFCNEGNRFFLIHFYLTFKQLTDSILCSLSLLSFGVFQFEF